MEFVLGGICGGLAVGYVSFVVHRNLCRRLARVAEQELASDKFEKLRDKRDFGIDELARPGAGPPGIEYDLFGVVPGAMTLVHLEENGENLTKGVDSEPDSTTLELANGSKDHHIENR